MRAFLLIMVVGLAGLSGCLSNDSNDASNPLTPTDRNGDDVVVVAVIDSGINPYHFDYRAAMMPQHRDSDESNDLPLGTDPALWVPGHPGAAAFASYTELALTLSEDPDASANDLASTDSKQWGKMRASSSPASSDVNLAWVPGTKIVGLVSFSGGQPYSAGSHGGGSASVSTGNFHGTCPECLLVFVNGPSHAANEWVASQDWIDAQTNSWGFSTSPIGLPRDRIHSACDLDAQRTAVTRGQQIFFSAGNGLGNAFTAPNPTLFSCQEGPDWIVTVGAINPADGSSFNSGTPADIAAPGTGYASAYCNASINCTGNFGGTSNATPVTTGIYAKSLWEARRMMAGASRTQDNGTISVGEASCVAPGCALADGILTVHELRQALYDASVWQNVGRSVITGPSVPASTEESMWLAEGHGSLYGLMAEGQDADAMRVMAMLLGSEVREYPSQALDYFTSLSYCTQMGWGEWEHGAYNGTLPTPNPAYPASTWMQTGCPTAIQASQQIPSMTG